MAQIGSIWHGDRIKQAVLAGAIQGLNQAGEHVLGEAVKRAPIDRGDLRGSAQVEPASAADLSVDIVFDTPYAVIQHERLDFHHEQGEAKYLERPLREEAGTIGRIVANKIAQANG